MGSIDRVSQRVSSFSLVGCRVGIFPAMKRRRNVESIIHTIMDPTKNNSFHARLLDAVGQAVIATDPLGKVLYWNKPAESLYGLSAEEVLGRSIVEVTPSDEMVDRAEEIMGELGRGRSWTGELAVRRKDGTTFPTLVTDTPVHDEQGNLVAIIGVSTDITEVKQTEELRRSEERFRLLAEHAPDLIYRYRLNPTPGFEYVSPSATAMLGYTPEEHYADPELGFKILHPDDRHLIDEMLRHPQSPITIRWLRKDGTIIWTEQRNKPLYDEGGEMVAIEGIARDITERKRAEEALRENEEKFRSTFNEASIGMTINDLDGRFLQVNRSLCEMFGRSEEALLATNFQAITHPDDLGADLAHVSRMLDGEINSFQMEKRYHHTDGHVVWASLNASLVRDLERRPLYLIGQLQDITERKALEEQLKHQAFYDSLTGLPNRFLFMDRLGQALKPTRRQRERKVAILFMDLDNFKVVNDSLGHDRGDDLLIAVARRLRGSLRPEDTLARFGGDEFAILIEDVQSPEDLARVAERIVEDLREPFALVERELFVSASIGIALADDYTNSSEELLRDADVAMYRAKEDAAADYQMFESSMYRRVLARLELEHDLRRALEKEEFTLYYQPKFRLGQPDKIEGVEALLRWEHPQRGIMLPDEFISVAEETGLFISIGRWITREACRQAKEWQERYPSEPPLAMCVNLSAEQVRHPGLLNDVRSALEGSSLEPDSLILEITEGALLKDTEIIETIFKELKALGVRLTIDDFGKEYSSLAYLSRLPVDALKTDRLFLENFREDSSNTLIVEAVISLAHSLGLEVTGEGVESAEQLEILRGMGCDSAQGYHLARPLPSEKVESLLAAQPDY